MDSMRSLNTSLPSTLPRRHTGQPTEQLLSAFKSAALSVTNLYKTAAADQSRAQETGYQDALEELLSFIDKEALGQAEGGEGWKVRQWITERLQGSGQASSDSDEEGEEDKRARSSSPILQRKPSRETLNAPSPLAAGTRPESAPPMAENPTPPAVPTTETLAAPPQSDFTFRSTQTYPNDTDMEAAESSNPANAAAAMPSMRLEVFPRASRNPARHNSRTNRTATAIGTLGHGAGLKRRVPFGDFFDISNLGNGKDGVGGGGKRNRFV